MEHLHGKVRGQSAWRALHRQALLGMNYGRGGVEESGERYALTYAHAQMPMAQVILDVGSNIGDWSRLARATWPDAQIHAFEPSSATFTELVAASAEIDVLPVRAACGEAEGDAVLYAVPALSILSSLYMRDLQGHRLTMSESETVPVVTLDGYCADQGISQVDYLKIDAEGHDLAVLKGAAGLLEAGAVRFVQFEFGGANIDSRTYLRDFVRLLEPTHRIHRMLSDGLTQLRYTELDEVFTTSNFLAEPL